MAELADAPGKSRGKLLDAEILKKKFFEVSNFRPRYFSLKTLKFFPGFPNLAPCGKPVKIGRKPKMTKTKNFNPKDCIVTKNDKIPAEKFFSLFSPDFSM